MKDLKDQFRNELEKEFSVDWEQMDVLKKFLIYKASDLKIDCDVSKDAIESYKRYNYLQNKGVSEKLQKGSNCKYEIPIDNHIFRGDTMTSGWWFVQQVLAFYTKDEYPGIKVNREKANLLELKDKVTIENLENNLKIDGEKKSELLEAFQSFLECVHSVGNMIMVPSYFNAERAGNYAEWDCWDITLHAICSWFKNNDVKKVEWKKIDVNKDKWLIKLFSKGSSEVKINSVRECKYWLSQYFNNHCDFIQKNFLQDYCANGYVKSFINEEIITETNAEIFFNKCKQLYKPNYRSDNGTQDMINYLNNFADRTKLREQRINGEI